MPITPVMPIILSGDGGFNPKIAKRAHKNGTTLKEESIKSGLITEKEYDKIVNPKKMIKPQ